MYSIFYYRKKNRENRNLFSNKVYYPLKRMYRQKRYAEAVCSISVRVDMENRNFIWSRM